MTETKSYGVLVDGQLFGAFDTLDDARDCVLNVANGRTFMHVYEEPTLSWFRSIAPHNGLTLSESGRETRFEVVDMGELEQHYAAVISLATELGIVLDRGPFELLVPVMHGQQLPATNELKDLVSDVMQFLSETQDRLDKIRAKFVALGYDSSRYHRHPILQACANKILRTVDYLVPECGTCGHEF